MPLLVLLLLLLRQVSDLTLVDTCSVEAVEALLEQAMERRAVGCTQLNEQSSRSHMVFTLRLEGRNSVSGQQVRTPSSSIIHHHRRCLSKFNR